MHDFLTAHLLFGPFVDNVHIYGPIFSEVSRLALAGAVPYYLPDIGTGFPVLRVPIFRFSIPFIFLGCINYGGPLASLYTLTYLTLVPSVRFLHQPLCPTAVRHHYTLGLLHWCIRRDAGVEHGLYASWITITASYAWLPLVLAGGVLLLRFPGKACGILVFQSLPACLRWRALHRR